MSLLTTLAATLGAPSFLLALVLIAVSLLELERRWTRMRRFAGMPAGALAFVLDSLVILTALLVVIGIALMLTQAIASVLQYTLAQISGLAWSIDGTAAGLTIGATIALIALIALVRRMTVRLPSFRSERAGATLSRLSTPGERHPPSAAPIPATPDRATSGDEEEPHLVMLRARQTMPRPVPTPQQPWSWSPATVQPEPEPSTQRLHWGMTGVVALLLAVGGAGFVYRDAIPGMLSGLTTQTTVIAALPSSADVPVPSPVPAVSAIVAPTSAPQTWQVAVERLNLRAGPGTGYPVVTTLKGGDAVESLGETAGSGEDVWLRVRAGTQEGWVFRAFLREPTSPSP